MSKEQFIHRGDNHYMWKGDNANYFTYHCWLIRNYGKATHCENPSCRKRSTLYEYALKKGFKHSHNKNHYIMLCRSCHRSYDLTEKQLDTILNNLKKSIGHRKGKPHTDETKLKIRLAKLGSRASMETRKKMSESRKRFLHPS